MHIIYAYTYTKNRDRKSNLCFLYIKCQSILHVLLDQHFALRANCLVFVARPKVNFMSYLLNQHFDTVYNIKTRSSDSINLATLHIKDTLNSFVLNHNILNSSIHSLLCKSYI